MLAHLCGPLREDHLGLVAVVDDRHQDGGIAQVQPLDDRHQARIEQMIAVVAPRLVDRTAVLVERPRAKHLGGKQASLIHARAGPVRQPA